MAGSRSFNADAFASKLNFMNGGASSSTAPATEEDDGPGEAKSWLAKLGQATNKVLPAGAGAIASLTRATSGFIPESVTGSLISGGLTAAVGVQRVASATGSGLSRARSASASVTELAISRGTWMSFFGCLLTGSALMSLAFCFLPMIVVVPQKFALLYTLGSLFIMTSFSILRGHTAFIKHLLSRSRALFSTTYVISMLGTLWASLVYRSQLLTMLFALVQMVSLSWFLVSYIPGGKRVLSMATGMGWRMSKMCCRCASKGSLLPF